ncbi:MAG: hypothetical protein WDZ82_00970 [Candidatus Paceibacterota bacterium]
MNEQENDHITQAQQDMSGRSYESIEPEPQAGQNPAGQDSLAERPRKGFLERYRAGRVFGSFVYVYFALFVVFHVAVALVFLMTSMNPMVGLVLWIIMMLLGGFSVVALSLWRDHLRTFWDR